MKLLHVSAVSPSSSCCSLVHHILRSRNIHIQEHSHLRSLANHRNTIGSITPLVFFIFSSLGIAMTNVTFLIFVFKLKHQAAKKVYVVLTVGVAKPRM